MSSAYREALVNDPVNAEALADLPVRRGRPMLREYDAKTALLTAIADRLTEVATGIAALGGAKPGKPEQLPRPVTEVDRIRERRDQRTFASLLDDVKQAQERWALEHPDDAGDGNPPEGR